MPFLTILFSRRCCGGPVVLLSLGLVAFGLGFAALSAAALGIVFTVIGAATLALCWWLGQARCGTSRAVSRAPRPQTPA